MLAHSIDPWLDSVAATADLLRAVAWPIVVLVVLYVLRKPLLLKFQDLLSVKGGGIEATFQVQPESTAHIARDVEEPAKALTSENAGSPEVRRSEVSALIERAVGLGFAAAGGIGDADVKVSWKSGEPDIRVLASHLRPGGTWEVFTDPRGRYRWRLKAASGEILAIGESYETKASAIRAIEAVRRAAGGGVADI